MNVFSLLWKLAVREPGMWMLARDGVSSSVIARCCLEGEREIRFRNFWNGCIRMTAAGFARRLSHQNWKRKDSGRSFESFAPMGQCDGCVGKENSSIQTASSRTACWESRPILLIENKLKKRCKRTSRNSASSLTWPALDGGSGTRKRDM